MAARTMQDMLSNMGEKYFTTSNDMKGTSASIHKMKLVMNVNIAKGKKIQSTEQAILDMMVKRASLQERMESARAEGDKKAELVLKRQLMQLSEQSKLITEISKSESAINDLKTKRLELEKKLSVESYAQSEAAKQDRLALVAVNDELVEANENYNTQLKVLSKVNEGVMDLKKAHEQVNEEIEKERAQIEMMSKGAFAKLGQVMHQQFGEGWDRIRDDVKSKLLMFTSLGASVGFGLSAMKDLSKDSEEVVNTLYRMGGSLDRVNNKFTYYASSVASLNRVQTSLRTTAALMNMPVEAIEGMTDQIMSSIRVLDAYGRIDFSKVRKISEDALNFARRTGMDAKEAVSMVSSLMNKYGQDYKQAGETLNSIAGSITAANDTLEDLGQGKAGIFIEDLANLMKEAADNSDSFGLSLIKLGSITSNQMLIAKKFGATYNDALEQAKALSGFLTKRTDYTNYRAGVSLAKSMNEDKDLAPFIQKNDIDGLTKQISKKYGLGGNEANIVAKALINKQGNWQRTIGQFLGGTKQGMGVVTGQLEKFAMDAAKSKGGDNIASQVQAAGAMGLQATDENFQRMWNTWVQAASERVKKGGPETGFISGTQFEESEQNKKAQMQSGAEGTKKDSPVTPVVIKELIEAQMNSPTNKILLATAAALVAVSTKGFFTSNGILAKIYGAMVSGVGSLGGKGGVTPGAPGIPGGFAEGAATAGTGVGKRAKIGGFLAKNSGMLKFAGAMAAMYAMNAVVNKMQESADRDTLDDSGNRKTAAEIELAKLKQEAQTMQEYVNDKTVVLTDAKRAEYQSRIETHEARIETLDAQIETHNARRSQLEKKLELIEQLRQKAGATSDRDIKAKYERDIETLEAETELEKSSLETESLGITRNERGLETVTQGISKHAAKSAANYALKLGTKTTLRAIPLAGPLLSAAMTAYMTEGSVGRKMFAASGDLGGTALGQVATGGLGGGTVGGIAGEFAGLEAYDRMFGSGKSPEYVTPTVPHFDLTPEQQASGTSMYRGQGSQQGPMGGEGSMTVMGQWVNLKIPMRQLADATNTAQGKMLQNKTGIYGGP